MPRHRHTPEIEQELAALGATLPVTFTPHLLPLDQGELVSLLRDAAEPIAETSHALYAEAYADEPFVELADRPPGVRDVRETNICRISVHRDERTGRAIVFGAIDNLWKGAASQAVQNLNLMFGRPEGEGIVSRACFASRWVEPLDHVAELDPPMLPAGFRAAGVAAGLKPDGLDVGVLVLRCAGDRVRRPVHHQRAGRGPGDRLPRGRHWRLCGPSSPTPADPTRATGERGLDTARATQALAAELLGVEPAAQVGVASTGVIGTELPREPLLAGVRAAVGELGRRRRAVLARRS